MESLTDSRQHEANKLINSTLRDGTSVSVPPYWITADLHTLIAECNWERRLIGTIAESPRAALRIKWLEEQIKYLQTVQLLKGETNAGDKEPPF